MWCFPMATPVHRRTLMNSSLVWATCLVWATYLVQGQNNPSSENVWDSSPISCFVPTSSLSI